MIVIADLHLGKVSDSLIRSDGMKSQTHDVLVRLGEVSSIAEGSGETIVIAGDIFNKVNPPSEIIGAFFGWLGSVKTDVVIMPGNHDCGVNWANIGMLRGLRLPNVEAITEPVVVDIEGNEVLVVPHIPLADQEAAIAKHGSVGAFLCSEFGSSFEMIVGHGMLSGLEYNNDIFFEAGDALDINLHTFPRAALIVIGHVHKHTVYIYRNKPAVYPGSTTFCNFGEVTDEKGYVHVFRQEAGIGWKFVPYESEVTPYKDITIDLLTKDTVNLDEAVLERVASGAVIKLKVMARNRIQVDEVALRKAFNRFGYVSRFEVEIQKSAPDAKTKSSIYSTLSPETVLRRYISGMDAPDDIKKLAISDGKRIIQEVQGALNA